MCPLKSPFPFLNTQFQTKSDQKNPLRIKFYQQSNALLPKNLSILLTTSLTLTPFTFGYVLAPSMSIFNETYFNANENDRIESMKIMDLFAKLLHNGNININSPYCKDNQCEAKDKWKNVFPESNLILLRDGNFSQVTGHHTQVHYLFNTLISNLTEHPFDTDLLNTWKT
ncbi:unnamed protein product, partial [Adineta ricciae]